MLEHQHAQDDFRGRTQSAPGAAPWMTAHQGFIHQIYQLFIVQNLVHLAHPVLPHIVHRLGEETLGQVTWPAARLNHGPCCEWRAATISRASSAGSARKWPPVPSSVGGSSEERRVGKECRSRWSA